MSDQYAGEDDLVTNTAARVPVCLCIDTSASMGKIIRGETHETGKTYFKDGINWNVVEGGVSLLDDMEDGIKAFYEAIEKDNIARESCEICIVTFDDVARLLEPFKSVEGRQVPDFELGGETSMAAGVEMALKYLDERKAQYKQNGVEYYQPWLVIFTDGVPTDDVTAIQAEVKKREAAKKLTVLPFALTDDVDKGVLGGFSAKKRPLSIKDGKLSQCFEWLGKSVGAVAASQQGEAVQLDTSGISSWGDL
jgi:uncharacterized protein YegL